MHKDVVELLLQAGADFEKPMNEGLTPVFTACHNGHDGIVDLLLRAGADIYKPYGIFFTPLFIAVHEGHREIANLLRQAGADEDRTLLLHHLPKHLITPSALKAIIADNFKAVAAPRPSLQKLRHSAIHCAIHLLLKDRNAGLPIAQEIISTFPGDHPTLPLLQRYVQHQDLQPSTANTLSEELKALLIAELINDDQTPNSKKKAMKKK